MKILRVATTEEVEKFAATSDIEAGCLVVALDTPEGTFFAVIRRPPEVDPIISPEGASDRWKYTFCRDIETFLLGQGVTHYYFNVHAKEEKWRGVVENAGAVATSTEPEIRYKKVIIK